MIKLIKRIFGKKEEKSFEPLSREELLVKSAEGSAYAIRRFHGALDKLAEYDREPSKE